MGASGLANHTALLVRWAIPWLWVSLGIGACEQDPRGVVVIGGGPAGMAAAIEAAATAQVVLVEGQPQLGGSARYGAAITVIDGGVGLPTDYPEGVRREVLDWTRGLGVHWLPATDPSGLGTRLLQPEGGGAALTARMADRVAEAGVAIRLDLRADGLTRTDGWQVALADGSVLDSDAVVVATGGFMGSLQRARDTLGLPDLLVSAPAFVDGAGEDWLIAAGGTVPASRAAIVYGHAVRHPLDPTLALMVVDAPRGVIVDDAGRMMRAPLTPRGGIEPGQGPRYLVVDSAGLDQLKFFDPLSDTLYDARGVIRAGGWLAPDGSMAAIELMETGAKSLTGVNTDTDGRVLDLSRNPIPGLFAAGEVAGFGHASHPPVDNTMIASAILSGRAAGKAAARAR